MEIDGANETKYVTSAANASHDGFRYYCKVKNSDGGEMDSAIAILHVDTVPKTGDPSRPVLWMTVLLANAFMILILRKKAKN